MPLIDVTYDGTVGEEVLRRLGELLPDVVGEAVECPEEPSTGPAEPGDLQAFALGPKCLDRGFGSSGALTSTPARARSAGAMYSPMAR